MEGNDYRFLRTSSAIFNGLSWIALVFYGVISPFIILAGKGGPESPTLGAVVGSLLAGGVLFLLFKTVGGIVRILLEIESRLKP